MPVGGCFLRKNKLASTFAPVDTLEFPFLSAGDAFRRIKSHRMARTLVLRQSNDNSPVCARWVWMGYSCAAMCLVVRAVRQQWKARDGAAALMYKIIKVETFLNQKSRARLSLSTSAHLVVAERINYMRHQWSIRFQAFI